MEYRQIDLSTYPRREHFRLFQSMENPFISMTVNLDITGFLERVHREGKPFTLTLQYEITKAANTLAPFRQRIREGGIVEFPFCEASYVVLRPDGSYRYCDVFPSLPFGEYVEKARAAEKKALSEETLSDGPDSLSMYFFSSVPGISFLSVNEPYADRNFSNPSFLFGKYQTAPEWVLQEGQPQMVIRTRMPLVIRVNHALMDGVHLQHFLEELESRLA